MDGFAVWSVPDEFAPISMQMRSALTWHTFCLEGVSGQWGSDQRTRCVSSCTACTRCKLALLWQRMQWWTGIKFQDLGVALEHTHILQCSKTSSPFSLWRWDILHPICQQASPQVSSKHLWGGHWHLGTCPMEACSSGQICAVAGGFAVCSGQARSVPGCCWGKLCHRLLKQFNDAFTLWCFYIMILLRQIYSLFI